MKEQIKNFYLLLIILSLIALFSISCDNKNKTGAEEVKEEVKKEERTLSYYAGNWWGKAPGETAETNIFTINTDGSITLKSESGEAIIPSYSVTRVSDTDYTAIDPDPENNSVKYIFIFSSDTQGKFTMDATVGSTAQSVTVDITKK